MKECLMWYLSDFGNTFKVWWQNINYACYKSSNIHTPVKSDITFSFCNRKFNWLTSKSLCSSQGLQKNIMDSHFLYHIDGLVHERCNSIANTLELYFSCTNSLICLLWHGCDCIHSGYIDFVLPYLNSCLYSWRLWTEWWVYHGIQVLILKFHIKLLLYILLWGCHIHKSYTWFVMLLFCYALICLVLWKFSFYWYGVGGAVRFLVVGTIGQRGRPPRVSSGWSSVWHRSNTGLSSTQYEQIPIILGVWPFWLTPFFFRSITFWRAYG